MTSRTVHVTGTCSTSTRLQLNSKSTRTSSCTPHPASQRKVLSTLTAVAWSRMTFPVMTSSILRRRFLPQPIILWWTSFASMRWRIFTITQVSVHFYWANGKGCAYIENTMSTLHYVLSCFTDFHFFSFLSFPWKCQLPWEIHNSNLRSISNDWCNFHIDSIKGWSR